MGYAAYREHPGTPRASRAVQFYGLDVIVACSDAACVRRVAACCVDTGVVRCEPLLHEHNACENPQPRVRLMVRLPMSSYVQVLHGLIEAMPSGEIGRLIPWREHLRRYGLHHGL